MAYPDGKPLTITPQMITDVKVAWRLMVQLGFRIDDPQFRLTRKPWGRALLVDPEFAELRPPTGRDRRMFRELIGLLQHLLGEQRKDQGSAAERDRRPEPYVYPGEFAKVGEVR